MRLYDRIDISEGIDIDKTMHQKTIISLQWLSWFNAKAIAFNDVAIVSIRGNNYRTHFWYISKNNATNIMKNSNLNEKSGSL